MRNVLGNSTFLTLAGLGEAEEGRVGGMHTQVIDVSRGTLNNVITFPPSGSFVVDSTIEVVDKQRVDFRCSPPY